MGPELRSGSTGKLDPAFGRALQGYRTRASLETLQDRALAISATRGAATPRFRKRRKALSFKRRMGVIPKSAALAAAHASLGIGWMRSDPSFARVLQGLGRGGRP